MMAIIIRVAAGLRPTLQPVSEEWPGETQQMVDLMRRCWDQDPKKRPCFLGVHSAFPTQGLGSGEAEERRLGPKPTPEIHEEKPAVLRPGDVWEAASI
jgi:hypothetical protein